MKPDFTSGSLVFVSRRFGPRVGDVVVLKDPRDGSRIVIKRVSSITGVRLFLLGDNPLGSTDSRFFGSVDRSNILGKVLFKYPQNTKDWLRLLLIVFSLGGLIDVAYLTFKHFEGGEVACGIIPGADCDLVLGSAYSEVLGVPLALLGALYYLTVLGLAGFYLKSKKHQFLQALLPLTALGFLFSVYLIYIQAFVLRAFCAFCLISALTSTVLLGITIALVVLSRKRSKLVKLLHS
ncbi:MAG: vitamin K epoxide reductase family protein [Patescibacteria group bacterium]|nr:vitamin K epoxide reductase family protein [Patescibacteria group bacterium]